MGETGLSLMEKNEAQNEASGVKFHTFQLYPFCKSRDLQSQATDLNLTSPMVLNLYVKLT